LPQTILVRFETMRLLHRVTQQRTRQGIEMSAKDLAFYRSKIKQFGTWAGVRYLRNRGIPFEQAYFILFGRAPRQIAQ